eukprot:4771153-Prymnesium_polylepis.1
MHDADGDFSKSRHACHTRVNTYGKRRYVDNGPTKCAHTWVLAALGPREFVHTQRRDAQSPGAPPSSAAASHTEKGSSTCIQGGELRNT